MKSEMIIKAKEDSQFEIINNIVKCKCGHNAVWWKTGFLCGTITAYPCKFN